MASSAPSDDSGEEKSKFQEIVDSLKHSNSPTLIVEGKDDYVAFEQFEIENIHWGLTVLPVQGVENVYKIIELIDEIKHPALAFLIDQDCSIFENVPRKYNREDTLYTEGYSIENDLIRDGNVISFLRNGEKDRFFNELEILKRYFADAASKFISGMPGNPIGINCNKIFKSENNLEEKYADCINRIKEDFDQSLSPIFSDPMRHIHGKSLLSLFTRRLSHKARASKYSAANILEIGAVARGENMRKNESEILRYFQKIGVAPTALAQS